MLAQHPPPHDTGTAADWYGAIRRGDFAAAWLVNDAVLAARDPATRDDPSRPYHERWVWDGTPLAGRDVLVRCYHGLGDTLQFWRFLRPLRARAASVTVEVQPELLPLLQGTGGADTLVPFRAAAPLPPSECDVEIMELSHALRLPPGRAPYLSVPALPRLAPGLTVGLCWSAGAWRPERSVRLRALAPLAAIPGVSFVSLQRGPAAAEALAPGAPALLNPEDRRMEVLVTAGLIGAVDCVVTVDTMVAHLAGALGRPACLLLHHEPDWRWRAGGEEAVWYGSVRKYQQAAAGEWDGPVRRVAARLARECAVAAAHP